MLRDAHLKVSASLQATKPLLVGESNPSSSDPRHALFPRPEGRSGGRLRKMMGLSEAEYLRTFARINLCARNWDKDFAQETKAKIVASAYFDPIILLGAKVSEVFGLEYIPFSTRFMRNVRVITLPHPSGRCRIWNDPMTPTKVRSVLKDAGVL